MVLMHHILELLLAYLKYARFGFVKWRSFRPPRAYLTDFAAGECRVDCQHKETPQAIVWGVFLCVGVGEFCCGSSYSLSPRFARTAPSGREALCRYTPTLLKNTTFLTFYTVTYAPRETSQNPVKPKAFSFRSHFSDQRKAAQTQSYQGFARFSL